MVDALHEQIMSEGGGGGHIEGNPPPEGATVWDPANDGDYQLGDGPHAPDGKYIQ